MAETRKQTARKTAAKSARKRPAKKGAGQTTGKRSGGTRKTAEKTVDESRPADSGGSRRASATAESRPRGGSRSNGTRSTSPAQVAASTLEQLAMLTGRPSEGVVGIEREDGQWVVEIEVLELRRIPSTTDVLARYRVTADEQGELTGYRRLHRYPRGAAGEE